MTGQKRCVLTAISFMLLVGSIVTVAHALTPGSAFDYGPLSFYPDRWEEHEQDSTMYPWVGRNIVLLTNTTELDRGVMTRFVSHLDDGWEVYARITQQTPNLFKHYQDKPVIAAVPDWKLTCGYGCGYLGSTGIEIAGFYSKDYDRLKNNPKAMSHYVFYEMGRNYYVFGKRHSEFATGFAVFMRYVCMDTLKLDDEEVKTRQTINRAESLYTRTSPADITFVDMFTNKGKLEHGNRLFDEAGKPIGPSDINVMYASAMLRLRDDLGGNRWVRRFYEQLMTCDPVEGRDRAAAHRQCVTWYVAASCAARKDLAEYFVDDWRLQLDPETRATLKKVSWNKQGLTAGEVMRHLPD